MSHAATDIRCVVTDIRCSVTDIRCSVIVASGEATNE